MALWATLALIPAIAAAQPTGRVVDRVELQGLERVSEQLVRSQLEVQAGEPLNPRAVSRDLRRLFELGYFANVRAYQDEVDGQFVVTYVFEETRYIQEVRIIGNRKVKDREVRSALSWKEGDTFSPDGFDAEREAILDLYRGKGFLNPTVDVVAENIGDSRVRLLYSIDEGRKARIRSIDFVGNEALSDKRLRKTIETKRARWFFGGRYDDALFEEDLRNLVDTYGNVGRLEADIVGTEFEYSPNGKRLNITIRVAEGPEYRVETLQFADNFVYENEELAEQIEVEAGEVHDRGQIRADASALRELYFDSGYVNAAVEPVVTLDRNAHTTRVIHDVEEGQLKYLRDIRIVGNTVTRDEVIRRQLLLSPGDRLDGAALRASQERLLATEYFEDVNINLQDIEDDPRFSDLIVDVEEGRTGLFTFGGGYSTSEGVGGFVEYQLDNFDITNWPSFSGGGQQFAARIALGSVRDSYSISFTDPQFLGYPLAFGFDVFNESVRAIGGADFREDRTGAQIRFAKALSPYVTARTALRWTDLDISDLGSRFLVLNRDLRELRDPGSTVANSWGITRNTLNHFRDPSDGAVHDLTVEFAGLGGDNDFVKLEHDSTWYWGLDEDDDWVLSYRTREGVAWAYGDKELVPLTDRFFAGGTTTVRGYDNRDIGPRVRAFPIFGDYDNIGGEMRVLNNLEVRYRINELIRMFVFADAGGVWRQVDDFNIGDIKYSVGLGIGLQIPRIGPLRIDYGFPINPDEHQGSGRLHISTGFRF